MSSFPVLYFLLDFKTTLNINVNAGLRNLYKEQRERGWLRSGGNINMQGVGNFTGSKVICPITTTSSLTASPGLGPTHRVVGSRMAPSEVKGSTLTKRCQLLL